MIHRRFTDNECHYVRVSKQYARKHYKDRHIVICPVNLRPGFPWAPHMWLNPEQEFEEQCAVFEYYNCSSRETGYYSAFYQVYERTNSNENTHN